jgi:hypothetical protein
MKPFNDYEKTTTLKDSPKLPAGGYIAKIMDAEEVDYGSYRKLLISVDIAEGEYAGYYADNYRNNSMIDRKWKGVVRISIPNDDGSEADNFSKRLFKTAIDAVESSNPGYHWGWDETTLKGKTAGLLVRMKEWEYDGKHGWAPECFKLIDVNLIRSGKFTVPEDKPLNGNSSTSSSGSAASDAVSVDDDLPF